MSSGGAARRVEASTVGVGVLTLIRSSQYFASKPSDVYNVV
jgi:hypothetical protein